MQTERRAVIDVGTNSVKLLVADVHGGEVLPVWEGSHQTRLGQGFYHRHELQPGPIAATATAVAEFAARARTHGAVTVRALATSAAREAKNAAELVEAVAQASGLRLEIISGEQEAEWAFRGVTTDPALARHPLLLLEIGGGSTQFILGCDGQVQFSGSFPLGTVRLLHQSPHGDPPTPGERDACRARARHFLEDRVRLRLEPALGRVRPDTLVGVGGTASILARMEAGLEDYDRQRIESTPLSRDRLRWHLDSLWSLPQAERSRIPGLPANRADVILTGIAIFEAVMELFDFPTLRVSTRGLRFAALL